MSDQTNTNITRLRNTNLVTENPYSDDSDRPTISASGPCWFRCDQASSLGAVDASSKFIDEVDTSKNFRLSTRNLPLFVVLQSI